MARLKNFMLERRRNKHRSLRNAKSRHMIKLPVKVLKEMLVSFLGKLRIVMRAYVWYHIGKYTAKTLLVKLPPID